MIPMIPQLNRFGGTRDDRLNEVGIRNDRAFSDGIRIFRRELDLLISVDGMRDCCVPKLERDFSGYNSRH